MYIGVGKRRLRVACMEKDMQVMIITNNSFINSKEGHSALRYNLVCGQIASLHFLHIFVVYLLYSSTLWHRVLYCHQFLDMLLLCSESKHPQYVVFMKRLYLCDTPKKVFWSEVW